MITSQKFKNQNAQIKVHKDNKPIRPVINNIYAPTYKICQISQ